MDPPLLGLLLDPHQTEPPDTNESEQTMSDTPIYTQLVIEQASADPEARELAFAILRRKQARLQAESRPPRMTLAQWFGWVKP